MSAGGFIASLLVPFTDASAGAAGNFRVLDEPTRTDPAVAIFAGGCFWRMEPPFDGIDGVISTTLAEEMKKTMEKELGEAVVAEIAKAGPFYVADEPPQDYDRNTPYRYKLYRYGYGRDQRLEEFWDESKERG